MELWIILGFFNAFQRLMPIFAGKIALVCKEIHEDQGEIFYKLADSEIVSTKTVNVR